jgi:hypothetical protein
MTGEMHAEGAAAMPGLSAWLPGWVARSLAWRRQQLGRYDVRTAACFEHAWRRSRDLSSLVEWLRFRRELGLALDPSLAATLQRALGGRRDAMAAQAVELLHEVAAGDALEDLHWLRPHAERSPPIADMLNRRGMRLSGGARRLAGLHASQDAWRGAFAEYLSAAQDRVCVVGNSAALSGAGLGAAIDEHDRVVRFNRWTGSASARRDLGSRIDVWVCAPRFLPQMVQLGCDLPAWLILSGPDARYGRAGRVVDWELVLGMLDGGVKVLTFPLTIWGESVGAVGAPPSAGLLFLTWARRILGGFDRLAIAGFGIADLRTKGYHHAGKALRPGRRHAWDRERALRDAWKRSGLRECGS